MKQTLVIGAALDRSRLQFYADLITAANDVIAVDGGIAACRAANAPPAILVGDLDSASSDDISWAESSGTQIHRLNRSKDETDLEVALTLCGPESETIATGVLGQRLDHQLASLGVLFDDRTHSWVVREPKVTAWALIAPMTLHLRGLHSTVSLLGWSGPATITTEGCEYALVAEALQPFSARGVSNHLVAENATVELHSGMLLAVSPHLDFPPSMGYATPRTEP